MTQDQALLTWRRRAIVAGDDFAIGSAYAQRDSPDQDAAFGQWRCRNVIEPGGILHTWQDGERAHRFTFVGAKAVDDQSVPSQRAYACEAQKFRPAERMDSAMNKNRCWLLL
jgi:hypothetical protein